MELDSNVLAHHDDGLFSLHSLGNIRSGARRMAKQRMRKSKNLRAEEKYRTREDGREGKTLRIDKRIGRQYEQSVISFDYGGLNYENKYLERKSK